MTDHFDSGAFVRPDIAGMEPYVPIVPFDVLSARLGRDPRTIVKLDANENPYGPSPGARAALQSLRYPHIYPDPEANALRAALARHTGVPKELLLAGAGADELIDLVLRASLSPGDVVINCPPSFGMYPFSTAVNMGRLLTVARRPDFSLDVSAIKNAVASEPRARVLFLCSPNNPDGGVIAADDLDRLLALPILVVLDEAYVEFSGDSRIDRVVATSNLVVLRTFSKWAGLAGLRVGYGAFPSWLMPHLWKIKQPYNVNVAAAAAAEASLQDAPLLLEQVAKIVAERERLAAALAAFPFLEIYPSQANFLLCRIISHSALEVKAALEREGILVRHFAKPGLDDCIRISAGRPEDGDRLLAALGRFAGKLGSAPEENGSMEQ